MRGDGLPDGSLRARPSVSAGAFAIRQGAALHFRLGDRVAVVAYGQEESFSGANCVIVDPLEYSIAETLRYNTAAEAFVPAIEE